MDGANNPKSWELWYANVKYEDAEIYQDRPVLVIDASDEICILTFKVTSTRVRNEWGEYDIIKWRSAGLRNPSTVRCGHPINLVLSDFRSKIGVLQLEDIEGIQDLLL